MKYEEHCELTTRRFGQAFEHIHKDLDQDFTLIGSPHRVHRHHLEYVMEKLMGGFWNVDECRAAIHHIIDDCGVLMVQADWNNERCGLVELECGDCRHFTEFPDKGYKGSDGVQHTYGVCGIGEWLNNAHEAGTWDTNGCNFSDPKEEWRREYDEGPEE